MAEVKIFNKRIGKEIEYHKVQIMRYYPKGLKIIIATGEQFFVKYEDIGEMSLELNEL